MSEEEDTHPGFRAPTKPGRRAISAVSHKRISSLLEILATSLGLDKSDAPYHWLHKALVDAYDQGVDSARNTIRVQEGELAIANKLCREQRAVLEAIRAMIP